MRNWLIASTTLLAQTACSLSGLSDGAGDTSSVGGAAASASSTTAIASGSSSSTTIGVTSSATTSTTTSAVTSSATTSSATTSSAGGAGGTGGDASTTSTVTTSAVTTSTTAVSSTASTVSASVTSSTSSGVLTGLVAPQQLAFQARTGTTGSYAIHVRDLDAPTSPGTPIASPGDCRSPALSPDGARIAFACRADSTKPFDVYVQEFDGLDESKPVLRPAGVLATASLESPSFSANGLKLIFTVEKKGPFEIAAAKGTFDSTPPTALATAAAITTGLDRWRTPRYAVDGFVFQGESTTFNTSAIFAFYAAEDPDAFDCDFTDDDVTDIATGPGPRRQLVGIDSSDDVVLFEDLPPYTISTGDVMCDVAAFPLKNVEAPAFASENHVVVTRVANQKGRLVLAARGDASGTPITPDGLDARRGTVATGQVTLP